MRIFSFLTLTALVAASCGGKVIGSGTGTDGDAGPYGRGPDSGDGSNGYVDPHCPEAGPPPSYYECDVFSGAPCSPGEGCYPAAIPPQHKCETESYGSFCAQEGSGTQGAPCDNGAGCAAGFVCLITGASTQCARMCDLSGSHGCPSGYVCEPIDVPGFSACL